MAKSFITPSSIEDLIQRLEAALKQKYGGNFSYQVSANHRLIAAHNYRPDINWPPRTKE